MNKSQRIIIIIALLMFSANLLFFVPMEERLTRAEGLSYYWREPFSLEIKGERFPSKVNYDRLVLDFLAIATLTGALLVIFSGGRKKKDKSEK